MQRNKPNLFHALRFSVSIGCSSCDELFAIKHLSELFVVDCTDCDRGEIDYTWKVALVDDGSVSFYKYGMFISILNPFFRSNFSLRIRLDLCS